MTVGSRTAGAVESRLVECGEVAGESEFYAKFAQRRPCKVSRTRVNKINDRVGSLQLPLLPLPPTTAMRRPVAR